MVVRYRIENRMKEANTKCPSNEEIILETDTTTDDEDGEDNFTTSTIPLQRMSRRQRSQWVLHWEQGFDDP